MTLAKRLVIKKHQQQQQNNTDAASTTEAQESELSRNCEDLFFHFRGELMRQIQAR